MRNCLTTLPSPSFYSLVPDAPAVGEGRNRKVVVSCSGCGETRTVWASNFRVGKVSCKTCKPSRARAAEKAHLAIAVELPYALLDNGKVLHLLWGFKDVPGELPLVPGETLLKFESGGKAIPVRGVGAESYVSPADSLPPIRPALPTPIYDTWVLVPKKWLSFYIGEQDLEDSEIEEALEYYHLRLTPVSDSCTPTHSAGVPSTFPISGENYAYLYCMDSLVSLTPLALAERAGALERLAASAECHGKPSDAPAKAP